MLQKSIFISVFFLILSSFGCSLSLEEKLQKQLDESVEFLNQKLEDRDLVIMSITYTYAQADSFGGKTVAYGFVPADTSLGEARTSIGMEAGTKLNPEGVLKILTLIETNLDTTLLSKVLKEELNFDPPETTTIPSDAKNGWLQKTIIGKITSAKVLEKGRRVGLTYRGSSSLGPFGNWN